MMRIAISGFGRIGRNFLRVLLADRTACEKITVVAINVGPAIKEHTAHLFKYDTLLGTYDGSVAYADDALIVDNYTIPVIAEPDPAKINWKSFAVDWVLDASGAFTHADKAKQHCASGARHVLISAPAHGEDITIVPGVNHHQFDAKKHTIVSLGSCTTNAFIPLVKVMHESFGIERGMMVTTHAYTNSQVLLDVDCKDLRRARAAALNIIPTTTGASRMVPLFFPDLKDCIESTAIRVPVAKVSLIDLTFVAKKAVTKEGINDACKNAADTMLKGIMAVTDEPLVSSDFSGNSNSVIIDALMTSAHGSLAKVFGWYDNEWAYSVRLKDFLFYVAGQ
jgi:glyceraldehyde 3-phosphate dehydrogenase